MTLPPKKKGGGKCKELDFGNPGNFLGNLMVFPENVKGVFESNIYHPSPKKVEP